MALLGLVLQCATLLKIIVINVWWWLWCTSLGPFTTTLLYNDLYVFISVTLWMSYIPLVTTVKFFPRQDNFWGIGFVLDLKSLILNSLMMNLLLSGCRILQRWHASALIGGLWPSIFGSCYAGGNSPKPKRGRTMDETYWLARLHLRHDKSSCAVVWFNVFNFMHQIWDQFGGVIQDYQDVVTMARKAPVLEVLICQLFGCKRVR